MRTFAFALALALAPALVPTLAVAQPQVQKDRRELRQDQREVQQDRRAIADDRRDARRFAILLASFDEAAATGQAARLIDIDRRVLQAVDGEIRESNREVGQKGAEAARSQNEARREGQEVRRDMVRGEPVRAANDRRDVNRELGQNNRLRAIYQEYSALANRLEPPAVSRKRALLVELNNLAAAELRGDVREIREDKHETREDRRELRQDRRY